jgi:hypothetical protein
LVEKVGSLILSRVRASFYFGLNDFWDLTGFQIPVTETGKDFHSQRGKPLLHVENQKGNFFVNKGEAG